MNGRGLMHTLAALLLLAAMPAAAHSPSNSFLSLEAGPTGLGGRWDIAVSDLDHAVGIDADANGEVTWGEILAAAPALDQYALQHLQLNGNGQDCETRVTDHQVSRHTDGAYLVLMLEGGCDAKAALDVNYTLFFDLDRQHRGLITLASAAGESRGVAGPDNQQLRLTPGKAGRFGEFLQFLREGIWHIWIGFDHVLFLLCLLMPAVLVRVAGVWQGAASLRGSLRTVVYVATAFTVAHSLTLGLALFGIITVPSAIVEAVIAASIIIVALNNIRPYFNAGLVALAFGLGLVHGLGFATVLADLGTGATSPWVALAGFNIGVELGQLAIILVWVPLAYAMRNSRAYRIGVVTIGSLAIAAIAAVWLVERSLTVLA